MPATRQAPEGFQGAMEEEEPNEPPHIGIILIMETAAIKNIPVGEIPSGGVMV